MKKNKWLAVVFVAVFLILAVVIFLHRDSFFPGERIVTRERPEAASVIPEKDTRHDEKIVRKKIMPPGQTKGAGAVRCRKRRSGSIAGEGRTVL